MSLLIPRIGVGVIAKNDENLILLGRRINAHGQGCWGPPGGHLEFGETPLECAQRELLEETGLFLKDAQEAGYTHDIFKQENKQYVSLFVEGYVEGVLQLLEPEKCLEWKWFGWDALPEPLFLPLDTFFKKNHKNKVYANGWL